MDLQGSLVDTNLKIIPSNELIQFFKSLIVNNETPTNILQFVKEQKQKDTTKKKEEKDIIVHVTDSDISLIKKIKETVTVNVQNGNSENCLNDSKDISDQDEKKDGKVLKDKKDLENIKKKKDGNKKVEDDAPYLLTSDIDWIYTYIKRNKSNVHLHELLEGSVIETPENKIIKRNPVLEARCVKLRAQQEAREYRKMTKSVDNVRINYPEDSIAYQMKQINRQLIAIGQFILSIFAGFLFGFKGVEWMVGNLDFGFKLLLGVMCALIIALAEIYFLAKKLNEEMNAVETTQIGGPPKYGDEMKYETKVVEKITQKEHED